MRGQTLRAETCRRMDLPTNTPDPETLEALREFALAHNEIAFAHLVTAALAGEAWAIERIIGGLERVDSLTESDIPGSGRIGDGDYLAAKLEVIRSIDTTCPDGAVAKGFTDSLAEALTAFPRLPDPHAILRPRAVAALCALRRKPLSPVQLSHAIGDDSVGETRELLAAMIDPRDAAGATVRLVKQYVELTEDGVAWLETHGLSVVARS